MGQPLREVGLTNAFPLPSFVPVLFHADISDGKGKLTDRGKEALKQELEMVGHQR
jgi:hypothetical protein